MGCSPPGSSVHGILPARILEWVAISYLRRCSWSRDWTQVSCVSLYWQSNSLPLSHLGSHKPYASLVAQRLKHLPAMRETWVQSLGREDPLEKEMATHSVIPAWKIPWMVEPGRLQSMGLQRVGHNWATSLSLSRSVLGVHWRDWCWSWNSNTLVTWCGQLTHLKRPWCWEGLRAGGEGDDRGWNGWMASPTQWTWVWVDSRSWWWTGRPGVLWFMGLQRVGHDWATELNYKNKIKKPNSSPHSMKVLVYFEENARFLPV